MMSISVELDELKRVGARLSEADPGDHETWAGLLARRAELLDRVTAAIPGLPATEIKVVHQNLLAISMDMATPYRCLALERLLILQKLATLAQQKSVLTAFSPTAPGGTEPGSLVQMVG